MTIKYSLDGFSIEINGLTTRPMDARALAHVLLDRGFTLDEVMHGLNEMLRLGHDRANYGVNNTFIFSWSSSECARVVS